MEEIWKDVPNYEWYQVSNLGNVRSLDRVVNTKGGGKRLIKGIILRPAIDTSGYYHVVLYSALKKETTRVHKLVAMVFLNHIPNGHTMVVNHIDLDRTNNNLNNLEIITHRDNSNQKHINSSSKYVGVSWNKKNKKWVAYIGYGSKKKHLGSFDDEFKAHQAYQKKLKEIM